MNGSPQKKTQEINSEAQRQCTGEQSSAGSVVAGENGWLFETDGVNGSLALFAAQSSFTDAHAQSWVELLRDRADRLNARGAEYVHLVVPDKLTLYGEHYPEPLSFTKGSPIRQLDSKYVHVLPNFLNTLDYLQSASEKHQIYWKTGSNWTPWGCFLAYQMLCSTLHIPTNTNLLNYPFEEDEAELDLGATQSPGIKETERTYQFDRFSDRVYANALVRYVESQTIRTDDVALDGAYVIYRNRSPEATQKTLMLFGDAFSQHGTNLLSAMLAETVSEVHFVWSDSLDDELIRMVQPDIVVTQMSERCMTIIPADDLDVQSLATQNIEKHHLKVQQEEDQGITRFPERVRTSVECRELLSTESYALETPLTYQDGCDNECADTHMIARPVQLVDAKDVKVYFTGQRALAVASCGTDILEYGVDDERRARIATEQYRRLHGTSLLLAPTPGAHCYYHWMVDILPRLGLLQRQGVNLDEINHFIIRTFDGEWQKQTLAHLGIDESRVVMTHRENYLHCDRLLHIDMDNGINLTMNRFIPLWLKHAFSAPSGNEEPIKLYISRPPGVRRRINNEEDIFPLLEQAGFQIHAMEGMSVMEQVTLLRRAEVVMSPHGGALTNMVFCRPGIQIVELFSRHVYPYYYGLARLCGHAYHAILENPQEDYKRLVSLELTSNYTAPEIQWTTHNTSFDIPLDAVKAVLKQL